MTSGIIWKEGAPDGEDSQFSFAAGERVVNPPRPLDHRLIAQRKEAGGKMKANLTR
jgi:hypothetical protein